MGSAMLANERYVGCRSFLTRRDLGCEVLVSPVVDRRRWCEGPEEQFSSLVPRLPRSLIMARGTFAELPEEESFLK